MRRLLATMLAYVPCASASASNPCTDFLENYPGDPNAKQKCIEWLESLEQLDLGSDGFATMTSESSGLGCPEPLHLFREDFEDPSVDDPEPTDLAAGNQREPLLAADPNGGFGNQRLYALSFTDPVGGGLLASRSSDSGQAWISKPLADGDDGLPIARADPWAVFTEQGTLFVSYLFDRNTSHPEILADTQPTVIAMSTDGGDTFEFVGRLGGEQEMTGTDRGSLATGPGGAHGTLWAIYRDTAGGDGPIVVAGAELDANGEIPTDACGPSQGSFCESQTIAVAPAPGHVAVGPTGEVLATFIRNVGSAPNAAEIFAVVDPDGLGPLEFPEACPPLEPPGSDCVYPVTTTNVHFVDSSPLGVVSPLANVAWNRSTNRAYLVTTSQEPPISQDFDIELWYSDDVVQGVWEGPIVVNQVTTNAQVLPHIDVDQSTGVVTVAWYDLRNDDGIEGGTDTEANNEYQLFVGVADDGDAQGAPVFTDSALSVDSACSPAFSMRTTEAEPTDYLGVAAIDRGVAAVWADNSNSAGDNDTNDCTSLPCMDIYLPEPRGLTPLAAAVCGLLLARPRRARKVGSRSTAPR